MAGAFLGLGGPIVLRHDQSPPALRLDRLDQRSLRDCDRPGYQRWDGVGLDQRIIIGRVVLGKDEGLAALAVGGHVREVRAVEQAIPAFTAEDHPTAV